MVCQNCTFPNPDGQAFCGNCGHRLTVETIGSLSERIAKIENTQKAEAHNKIDGHALELETAARVMGRVRTWTTLVLYFTGIPVLATGLFLAVVFGKSAFDLRSIAANAKSSVQKVLQQAQAEGEDAKNTADAALKTSKQIDIDIKSTQSAVSKLQSEVNMRSADVQTLNSKLDNSEQQLAALISRMKEQDVQLHRVSEQARAIETARGIADIQTMYPVYGRHVARYALGYLDAKAKPSDAIYVDFNLSLVSAIQPNISDKAAGDALTALRDHKYTVMIGSVYIQATTVNSAQGVGMVMDSNACSYWIQPSLQAPCIIYFHTSLKNIAVDVRNLVNVAQNVPDDHVVYSDPAKLKPDQRELLDLSGMDIVVVLGQY